MTDTAAGITSGTGVAGRYPDLVDHGGQHQLRQAGGGLRERPQGLQQETGQSVLPLQLAGIDAITLSGVVDIVIGN